MLAIYTPYYFKGFPLDLIVGAEYKNRRHRRRGDFPQEGKTNFLLPIAGLATDRTTELFSVFGSVQAEPNLPGLIGTSDAELQKMGRFNVSRNFIIGKYSFGDQRLPRTADIRQAMGRLSRRRPDPAKRKHLLAHW